MRQKRTLAADAPPMRVVFVTLDNHLRNVVQRAQRRLQSRLPSLQLSMHAASNWDTDPNALAECKAAIEQGDIIVVTMLFMENHIQAVMPELEARRDQCDAMICCMSASEVMKQTRMGRFSMEGEAKGPMALLKRLRGKSSTSRQGAGAQQLSVLRRLPRILRFIPGTAQDVRAYFLTLQYWLAASEENLCSMVQYLVARYASGERAALKTDLEVSSPIEYPEVGVYHPALPGRISDSCDKLPKFGAQVCRGTIGVLIMRSYALAGNTAHYDAVIAALEAKGYRVITAFASGLDARPAIKRFFFDGDTPCIDGLLSLTGFSLVGGPAYNDANAAEEILAQLDVPYISAQSLEFQSVEQWQDSVQGLTPIEATMMVSIPELEGATGPTVFGGRSDEGMQDMEPHPERIEMLASRLARLAQLRKIPKSERKLAIVLFNFPPNAGSTGTAAYLSVFESLYNTLKGLQAQGYAVDLPESTQALQEAIINGNAASHGVHANVAARIDVESHVRDEIWLSEIEAQWGPAPGKHQSDGRSLFVLGAQLGNIMIGVQPAFGYEGDPMRLLFEGGFSPTHVFSAFYRYLRQDFGADSVLHFGTHGALEFMPGKQVGMSENCWPDRLIGDLPNFYLYASNNPSEALLAKRRSAATMITYLTPPVTEAQLYRGLAELKESIDRWRKREASDAQAERDLVSLIRSQAEVLGLDDTPELWEKGADTGVDYLRCALLELEHTLIPFGLHVVGGAVNRQQCAELLDSMAKAGHELTLNDATLDALMKGAAPESLLDTGIEFTGDKSELMDKLNALASAANLLQQNDELSSLIHALDGHYIRPAPGGDVLRNPDVLPTGRNLHGFDPYSLPSAMAVNEGCVQAHSLLQRHADEGHTLPETVALVLWGSDNMKNEGAPIAQALALMGAEPRRDSYGRLVGAQLIPLQQLGRPRVDVIVTLSGIFRDLLPLQTRMLAEAALLAAEADEEEEKNYIRKHALAYQAEHDCDMETAALRVFSNAEGAYGSNVNQLIDSSRWDEEDELAEAYTRRKSFAYNAAGQSTQRTEHLQQMLAGVQLAYQNLDSVELGVTTVDHYFDTLGGISRAVQRASGSKVPVYISDHTGVAGKVRTLSEQVSLETRSRTLNPKWYESMLEHGYEGVRSIENHVTNTVGWSATTGEVAPWVYQQLSETFILDETMCKRLAELNPSASVKVARRLLEAQEREYWDPDESTLDALRQAGDDLEDWLEGVSPEAVA